MTNPFDNPFGQPPNRPAPPPSSAPAPHAPAPYATAVPGPLSGVRKVGGWVVLLFGALIVIAALVDWSQPGMSVAMTFFGAAFVLTGATMIWQRLPWRIAGPAAGILLVICFGIVAATTEPAAEGRALASAAQSG
ncbi:MAG: hypothetical protein WBA05_17370 [Gordonia sp. (in: high G+C Gram-positive bacteria)]|uniref:hypothetical protein n=1 Tax=Gordonia TaxID=2053 RepID=UPI003263A968